jgi:hypothetical protein
VQPPQLQDTVVDDLQGGGDGGAPGQREAELLVLVGGGDELVGVRLHADGDPQQHPGPHAARTGQRGQPVDLVERVHDDPADPGVQRPGQLAGRLVVAVEPDPLGREAGRQRHRQLAAGAHVEVQALLGDDPHDRLAQERLAGVIHVGAGEGRGELAAPRPHVVLVQDVDRRAEPVGHVADAQARDRQDAGLVAGHRARPQLRQ